MAEKSEAKTTVTVDQTNKKFQAQIETLKILKGIGEQNPAPCSKHNGFLAIELGGADSKIIYVTFRSLTGKVLFQGILSAVKSQVRPLTAADKEKYSRQFKAKFSVIVTVKKEAEEGK